MELNLREFKIIFWLFFGISQIITWTLILTHTRIPVDWNEVALYILVIWATVGLIIKILLLIIGYCYTMKQILDKEW